MIDFSNAKSIFIPEGEVSIIARGDEILWQKEKLPAEYQRVEYIESTGTQYIQLNTVFKNTDECYAQASILTTSNDKFFIAPRTWNNSGKNRFSLGGQYTGYFICAYGAMGTPSSLYQPKTARDSEMHTYSYVNKVFSMEDMGLTYDASKVQWSGDTTELRLFYGYNTPNACKIAYYRQKRDGVVIVDLIPCYRKSDGEVGMYDLVTGTFFTNQGTGEFICDRPKYKTELSYIESTGTEYIDTGATINTATDTVELAFQATDTTIYKWLFGEHDNNARFGLGTGDGANKRNVAYGNNTHKVSDSQIYNNRHIFLANESGVFLDGVKIADYKSFSSTSTLYLFNLNLSGGNYQAKAIVWSYKHTRNGTLIRDLIPVLDWDDKPCMYDKVSDELFYNNGEGEFLYE